jgi:hypothetical protein
MNEHRQRQEELARARRQFQQMVALGQIGARDRFGNPIETGDQMMVRLPFDLVYQVVAVNPVMDPREPPGLMDLVCTVTFPLRMRAGEAYMLGHVVAKAPPVAAVQPGTDNGGGPRPDALPEQAEVPARESVVDEGLTAGPRLVPDPDEEPPA